MDYSEFIYWMVLKEKTRSHVQFVQKVRLDKIKIEIGCAYKINAKTAAGALVYNICTYMYYI
jgi:hypothetical protein